MTITVEPRFADTRLIRQTPRYYGQFSLPPRKALAFSLNWIRLIRTPVEVKLICSQPGTAIQNRKRKISMFITSVACMYSHTLVRTAEIWQIFCIFPWKHFYHWIVMTDKFYRIILASLLVTSTWWRHCVSYPSFFFRKHCTCHTNNYMGKRNNCISLRICLWKMPCGKGWKWHCRETKFRDFLEEHLSLKCLQRSNFSSCAYTFKISPYAPVHGRELPFKKQKRKETSN